VVLDPTSDPTPSRFSRLEPATKAAAAYEALKDSIVRGLLRPGERLKTAELARQFGVSMIPVREALRQLEADGLVSSTPHVGAIVSHLPIRELRETILVRASLEGLAARLAVQQMTEADFVALERSLAQTRQQASQVEPHEFWLLNLDFHRLIWRIADNHVLCQLVESVSEKTRRFQMVYGMLPPRGLADLHEHESILALFRRHDAVAAESAMREHLETSLSQEVDHLATLNPPS
jgi:DNA-binding GntR family transcriptional regulator